MSQFRFSRYYKRSTRISLCRFSVSYKRAIKEPYTLINADCLDYLKTLPPDSIDSVVTDGPYGISFMSKKWDGFKDGKQIKSNRAFQEFCRQWGEQVIRVLKPGGYCLSFGGTRTYHRMVSGLEDAGFEIRDSISWLYSTGFPKSVDIAKAIDKMGRVNKIHKGDRYNLANEIKRKRLIKKLTRKQLAFYFPHHRYVTENWERTDEGQRIPNSRDYSKLIEIIDLNDVYRNLIRAEDLRIEILRAKNRVNDNTIYSIGHKGSIKIATSKESKQWQGWGSAIKPAQELIVIARKPLEGTLVDNVLKWGTGGLNIDACRIGHVTVEGGNLALNPHLRQSINGGNGGHIFPTENKRRVVIPHSNGRFPANIIHDGSDEVLALFPQQKSGKPGIKRQAINTGNAYSKESRRSGTQMGGFGDSGSAARFFYCAKVSRKERHIGMDMPVVRFRHGTTLQQVENAVKTGNIHPTVKPIALMKHLVTLVTPPKGLVLDPFTGSGTTGIAALQSGFRFIGIEREKDYVSIARKRIDYFVKETK